jgi:hypothetical protein
MNTPTRAMRLPELGTAKTIADLMLLIVMAWYEKSMAPKKKAIIIRAGQRYGLIDSDGRKTSKYFALVNDDVEKLCRELTGKTKQAPGLCACGCGRMVRGRARTATATCRKRLSRKISDVTEKPFSDLQVAEN